MDAWTLSVIIPVYNEETTVETAVRRVRAVPLDLEIIAIDDGSGDGTRAVLERLRHEAVIDHLLIHEVNQGKGMAVRNGIQAATGHVLVVQDADLEYDPAELPRLLEPIRSDRADAVFGSRFLGGPRRVLYFWHRLGNGVLTLVSNLFTDLNMTDMETCYKMIRTDLAKALPLRARRFGIEPEITAKLAQAGARIYEVPISYHGRTYSEGKKITWKDGLAAFWHILRSNLLSRRPERVSRSTEGALSHPEGASATPEGASATPEGASRSADRPAGDSLA